MSDGFRWHLWKAGGISRKIFRGAWRTTTNTPLTTGWEMRYLDIWILPDDVYQMLLDNLDKSETFLDL